MTLAPEREARRPLRWFVGVTLSLLLSLAGLNFAVNPLGYYATKLVRPLTWSSRVSKTELMAAAPPPGVLVLGSSRAMSLPPEEIARRTGLSAFNAAVDSARAEDYLALTRFAFERRGLAPKELVIGVDLEAFHDHAPVDTRLLTTPALRPLLTPRMRVDGTLEAARALVSYDQTRESLRALGFVLRGFPPDPWRFDADGLLHYLTWEQQLREGTFTPDVRGSFLEYDHRFQGFERLSERRKLDFEETIALAQARGARVRTFVTPVSDELRAHLEQSSRFSALRAELLAYLAQLERQRPGFTWSDFTDVRSFGGDPALFYDGAHIRSENGRRLVAALWPSDAVQ